MSIHPLPGPHRDPGSIRVVLEGIVAVVALAALVAAVLGGLAWGMTQAVRFLL